MSFSNLNAFGTFEHPIPLPFIDQWPSLRGHWKQVHGTQLIRMTGPNQNLGEADAFFSTEPYLPVAVMTADCVPLLMETLDQSAVMAIHAGWRGTLAQIVPKCLSQLPNELQRKAWRARLGPCIQSCCFEVGSDLLEDFRHEFFDIPMSRLVPKPNHIDLHAVLTHQLESVGIRDIERISTCTKCSKSPVYHSHRRQPGTGRQYSIIQLT